MKRIMNWLRSMGHADRRSSFSPPVPTGGRRRDDRQNVLKLWIDDIDQRSKEVEAMVQSMHEVHEANGR